MASHTQKGSVTVQAVQWTGTQTVAAFVAANPGFLSTLTLHSTDGVNLQVKTWAGVLSASKSDWIVLQPDNVTVDIVKAATFALLYN